MSSNLYERSDMDKSSLPSKRCPKCEQTKPLSDFHVDRSKNDGHKSWCKRCLNSQDRDGYAERKAAPVRPYGVLSREELRENRRQVSRKHSRKKWMQRHGGLDEWERMFAEQGGMCYLCEQPLPENRSLIHVDHDHECCPGGRGTRSCWYCRRGLTHMACNQIWGLARENPDLLMVVAENGERASEKTRLRLAGRQARARAVG